MLRVPSFDSVHQIGRFLADAGYDVTNTTGRLGLAEGLRADFSNLPVLLEKTEGETSVPVLARLFFVGWPVELSLCRRVLPREFF